MTQTFCAGLAALWLAACAEAPMPVQSDDAQPAIPDTCGAEGHADLVGMNVADVMLPADRSARVIGPRDAVTMDYVAERLNVDVDADGVITRVRCG